MKAVYGSILQSGDHPKYGDRRCGNRRHQYGGKDRRSGKDRRQTWPGAGKRARAVDSVEKGEPGK